MENVSLVYVDIFKKTDILLYSRKNNLGKFFYVSVPATDVTCIPVFCLKNFDFLKKNSMCFKHLCYEFLVFCFFRWEYVYSSIIFAEFP